jgi:hypothetical protein
MLDPGTSGINGRAPVAIRILSALTVLPEASCTELGPVIVYARERWSASCVASVLVGRPD